MKSPAYLTCSFLGGISSTSTATLHDTNTSPLFSQRRKFTKSLKTKHFYEQKIRRAVSLEPFESERETIFYLLAASRVLTVWTAFIPKWSHPYLSTVTVNSRYCGHSRDRDLVSVLARVRNSGVREKKLRKRIYGKSIICIYCSTNKSRFRTYEGHHNLC